MVLDLAAPLFSMIPILQLVFDVKDQFSFLYVEETRAARWLNMNKTLDEQAFKIDKGLLLLYPLKNLLKENAAYKAEADLTGELIIRKYDGPSTTFATLRKGSKTKCYVALHDHFLLIFSSSEASVPRKVLSLEHFRVKYIEKTQEITLTRTFHGFEPNGKKGPSFLLSSTGSEDEDDNKMREWFEKIQINCGLIGDRSVFGVELDKVSVRRGPENPIPLVIEQIIAFLLSMLSKEEEDFSNLFVAPADATLLDFYKQHFDQGLTVEFTNISGNLVNTVGQLLMTYLADLPTPLLTYTLFDQFMEYGAKESVEDYEDLKKLVMLLPQANRLVLCCILEFFAHIPNRHSELAIIFGPIFLRAPVSLHDSQNLSSPRIPLSSASPPLSSSSPTTTLPFPSSPPFHVSFSSPVTSLSSPSIPSFPSSPSFATIASNNSNSANAYLSSVVVGRLIDGYSSILEHSREGALVRRVLVKTRYKINTLSGGTNTVVLPGTMRSVKSEVVDMASSYQQKRQETMRNAKVRMQEIEERFSSKSAKSSLRLSSPSTSPSVKFSPSFGEVGEDSRAEEGENDDSTLNQLSRSLSELPPLPPLPKGASPLLHTSPSDSHLPPFNHEKKNIYFVATSNPRPVHTLQSDEHYPNTRPPANVSLLEEIKQVQFKSSPNLGSGGTGRKKGASNPKILQRKGAMVALVCAKCKAAMKDNDKVCNACGHKRGSG